jgi:hypothetical protein
MTHPAEDHGRGALILMTCAVVIVLTFVLGMCQERRNQPPVPTTTTTTTLVKYVECVDKDGYPFRTDPQFDCTANRKQESGNDQHER